MNNLIIENPTKLTDNSFKITINGKDFEYEISEEKDIDAIIEKLQTWIERGEDSFGGLYDYIKRTFKLVGEYEEPVEEEPTEEETFGGSEMEEPEEPEIEIPSESVDMEDPLPNQLDIEVDIDENQAKIQINDWSANFTIIETEDEHFTDILKQYINDEMTMKDRTQLMIELAKSLESDDMTDFYNLFNLILDTGVDIINSFDQIEEEEPAEEEPIEEPVEEPTEEEPVEEPTEERFESENIKTGKRIVEDIDEEPVEEPTENDSKLELENLIKDNNFIKDLIRLDLSLFEITPIEKDEGPIYFIGGINNIGNKYTLSYSEKPPIELIDQYDKLKEMPECLNNIENLNSVVDYIDKILNIVYNKELNKEENDERI